MAVRSISNTLHILGLRDVEPQKAGGRLRQAESVAGGQNDILCKGLSGHVRGVNTIRQPAP